MTDRKNLRQILNAVDPALTVLTRGRRRRKTTQRDWEAAAGDTCPRCGQPALRFRPEDGVCISCARGLNEKEERDKKKKDRFQKFRKNHNARINRKRAAD